MRRNAVDGGTLSWRKSSYSNPDGGACVEVAEGLAGVVPVRDSKDPDGPVLLLSRAAWRAFVAEVRAGRLG